jgi:hypothetical protein
LSDSYRPHWSDRARYALVDAIAAKRARERGGPRPRMTELGNRLSHGMSAHDFMYHFENLGENCEFGLVQRRCGAEPLGLFRFAAVSAENLARALEAGLAGIAEPERLRIELEEKTLPESVLPRRAFYAHNLTYDLMFHTGFADDQGTSEGLHPQIVQRLRFLRRKLVQVLGQGQKILVLRSRNNDDDHTALRIGQALSRFGPNLLLWVTSTTAEANVGRLEPIAERVLKGHIEADSDWDSLAFETWLRLCEDAYTYWHTRRRPRRRTAALVTAK